MKSRHRCIDYNCPHCGIRAVLAFLGGMFIANEILWLIAPGFMKIFVDSISR